MNTYAYVRGNPLSRIDPYGLADIFFGVEVDLTWITGLEFSGGIVIDTDSPLDSGFFGSVGVGFGVNVGAGITAGYAECDIEGSSYGIDGNVRWGSFYTGQGSDGGVFYGTSLGVGLGASINSTETSTFSVGDYINWALGK